MAAAQLRLLCVLALELVADAVQQLHVTLLGVLLQGSDKRPGHSPSSLPSDSCVLSTEEEITLVRETPKWSLLKRSELTYEVWVSLLPDHMITSAGDVLVSFAF